MMVVSAIKDEEREWQAQLSVFQREFEASFKKIMAAPQIGTIPFSGVEYQSGPETKIADYRSIGGEGETAKEAVDDFIKRFNNSKISGEVLIWRVPPEIAWDRDFCSQNIKWRVFARYAAL